MLSLATALVVGAVLFPATARQPRSRCWVSRLLRAVLIAVVASVVFTGYATAVGQDRQSDLPPGPTSSPVDDPPGSAGIAGEAISIGLLSLLVVIGLACLLVYVGSEGGASGWSAGSAASTRRGRSQSHPLPPVPWPRRVDSLTRTGPAAGPDEVAHDPGEQDQAGPHDVPATLPLTSPVAEQPHGQDARRGHEQRRAAQCDGHCPGRDGADHDDGGAEYRADQ
jgi:hypothetical protein